MTQEEINAKAKEYRKYRESCGVIDPVVLDEIEDACYDGCILAKNVIIKKACEFIKEHFSFKDSWHVEGETTILDKVIEDFKKYTEEQQ